MQNKEIIEQLLNNEVDFDEMLAAHLQTPRKVPLYKKAIRKLTFFGMPRFNATWSWYAFFGREFYFFYRKMYPQGVALFILRFLQFFVPFMGLGMAIFSGITAKYYYTLKFTDDTITAGYGRNAPHEVLKNMKTLGGYNNWALIIGFMIVVVGLIIKIGILVLLINYISSLDHTPTIYTA